MRKLLVGATAAAVLGTSPAAFAADYKVTGGKLDWTIPNDWVSGQANRTWLGYLTNSTGPGAANGSASVTAPATITAPDGTAITTVTTAATRGQDQLYTISYPVDAEGAGTYSDYGVGTVKL